MRTGVLLLVVVGLLAIRALAPPPAGQGLKLIQVPRGEYSLRQGQIWQISGPNGFEFDISIDGQGGQPVLTEMNHGSRLWRFDPSVGGWKMFMGNFQPRIRPGILLAEGHYKIESNNNQGQPAFLNGYWSRPSSTSLVNGDDFYLSRDRLWSFQEPINGPELQVPDNGRVYMVTQCQGAIERWDGNSWEYHLNAGGDATFGAPGVRLEPGRYRLEGTSEGWAVGYIAME